MKVILALLVVVFLAFLPQWHYILSGDIKNYYYPVANHFYSLDTLIYPPGANLYFSLFPTWSLSVYEIFFVGANLVIILALTFLSQKSTVMSLLVLAIGPIILFRFDLLVVLLIVLAILTFQNNHYGRSGFYLGLATITKFFPLILIPYFLLILWSRKKISRFLIGFSAAIIFITLLYLIVSRVNPLTITSGFYFNFSKSVHMESVIGTTLSLITSYTNPGPHGVDFINALWVLDPLYLLGHARIFRYLAPAGLILVYLFIFITGQKIKSLEFTKCLQIILSLVITSQVFSPQYLIWVTFLFPFIKAAKIDIALIVLILVCTQLIYPLNYGELVDFFNWGRNPQLFWILTTRNLLLLILTVKLFRYEEFLSILPKKKSHPSV